MKYNKQSEKEQALYSLSSKNKDDDTNSFNNTNDYSVGSNGKNYLLCGLSCTKSTVIIFNGLFIVSLMCF